MKTTENMNLKKKGICIAICVVLLIIACIAYMNIPKVSIVYSFEGQNEQFEISNGKFIYGKKGSTFYSGNIEIKNPDQIESCRATFSTEMGDIFTEKWQNPSVSTIQEMSTGAACLYNFDINKSEKFWCQFEIKYLNGEEDVQIVELNITETDKLYFEN